MWQFADESTTTRKPADALEQRAAFRVMYNQVTTTSGAAITHTVESKLLVAKTVPMPCGQTYLRGCASPSSATTPNSFFSSMLDGDAHKRTLLVAIIVGPLLCIIILTCATVLFLVMKLADSNGHIRKRTKFCGGKNTAKLTFTRIQQERVVLTRPTKNTNKSIVPISCAEF